MAILDVIRKRRSVRSYQEKPVEEEKLLRVLDAGRLAPSARNRQEWRFVVVTGDEERRKLMKASYDQSFVGHAPVTIAACGTGTDYVMACGQPAYVIDVAIAIDHMTLQAVSEGLGTCWIGQFDEQSVKELLGIPEAVRVVELLTLGYPSGEAGPSFRKPLDDIVSFGRWKW